MAWSAHAVIWLAALARRLPPRREGDTKPRMIPLNNLENGSLYIPSQRERLLALLEARGMVRLSEITAAGITAATASRLVREGNLNRLGRGLYQLPGAQLNAHHALAEVAKRVPRGVIALTSALAFHGITDQMPRRVWLAIGQKDWAPSLDYPPIRIVRFADHLLRDATEIHTIEDVSVPIFSVAKTIADTFRHRRAVGLDVAIQSLREALRQRKVTPADVASQAIKSGAYAVIRPYLEAFSIDG